MPGDRLTTPEAAKGSGSRWNYVESVNAIVSRSGPASQEMHLALPGEPRMIRFSPSPAPRCAVSCVH